MANLNDIFGWFGIGKRPTAQQFRDTFSSFWHRSERIPISQIFGLKEEIAKVTTNFKGYHTSLDSLLAENPQSKNKKDFYAWVGSPYPGTVYVVKVNGGAWTDTGEVPTQQEIDLAEYAKKENEKGELVVYAPNGIVPIPENVVVYDEVPLSYNKIDISAYRKSGRYVSDVGNGSEHTGGSNDAMLSKIPIDANVPYLLDLGQVFQANQKDVTVHFFTNQTDNNSYKVESTRNVLVIKSVTACFISLNTKSPSTSKNYDIDATISLSIYDEDSDKTNVILLGEKQYRMDDILRYESIPDMSENDKLQAEAESHVVQGFYISGSNNGKEMPGGASNYIIRKLLLKKGIDYIFDTGVDWNIPIYPFLHFYENADDEFDSGRIVLNKRVNHFRLDKDLYVSMSLTAADYAIRTTFKIGYKLDFKINAGGHIIDLGQSGGNSGIVENEEKSVNVDTSLLENQTISPNGTLTAGAGVVAKTELLKPNTFYEVAIGQKIDGMYMASLGGIPLPMSGRKILHFKTTNAETLYVPVIRDGVFDITDKFKVKEIPPQLYFEANENTYPFGRIGADLSDVPSIELDEPKWIKININDNLIDLTSTSNYSPVKKEFEYLDSNGVYFRKIAQIGGQGSGSMSKPWLHNIKFKLANNDGSKCYLKIGDWHPRSTFHIKVDFADYSHLKNVGCANFVTDWYRNERDKTKKEYPWEKSFDLNSIDIYQLLDNRARGVIAGVPCQILSNWNHYSSGTFNLNAFAENYGVLVDSSITRVFKGAYFTRDEWEELVTDKEGVKMAEEDWDLLNSYFTYFKTIGASSDLTEFKKGAGVVYDRDSWIDYILMAEFFYLHDNVDNNMLFIVKNGVLYPMWWDMDICFGSGSDGLITKKPTDAFVPGVWSTDDTYYRPFIKAYPTEFSNRYKNLRDSGRFSVDKIREVFGTLNNRFNFEWLEMDFYTWKERRGSITQGHFSSLKRILWWTEERLKFLDNKYGYNG